MKRLIAMSLAATLLACGNGVTGLPEEVEYAPELGVDLSQMQKLANGLYYKDLVVGTGDEVEVGENIQVAYTGWLIDATVFDSNPGICFALVRGVVGGGLIEGWIQGIPGMRVGGKRKLVIGPAFAYGDRGAGEIPGNATLVFDVEVLEIRPSC